MTEAAGTGIFPLLRRELCRLPGFVREGGPFLRLSRQADALFATNLPARASPEDAEAFAAGARALGWRVRCQGGVLLLTPGEERLCRLAPPLPAPPEGRGAAAEFGRMLCRYAVPGPPDAGFCLVLLRAIALAGLGGREEALLLPVREAYALGLRRRAAVRTPLSCALCAELCGVLERNDPNP